MPAMKCPNPDCPFLFDPSQVPAGAVLVCPRCGTRYTLPETAPVPTPPAAESAFDQSPPTPRQQPRGGLSGAVLPIVGLLAVLAIGIGVLALFVFVKKRSDAPAGPAKDAVVRVEDRNFSYALPGAGWAKDVETQNDMGVNVFTLKRDAVPPAWVALSVVDYDTRPPLPGEMHAETMRHLNRLFQYVPPDLKPEPSTWAGHPATKFFFRGEVKSSGVVCVGEAYEMAYQGVGYWFYAWAGEADAAALAPDFEAMRARFKTLDLRAKWTGKAPGAETFMSVKPSSRFRLTSDGQLWKAPDLPPTGEDPAAELLLVAELKSRGKRDFNPTAQTVVMVVPGKGDPAAVAEAYLKKRYVRDPELFGPTDIEVLKGDAPHEGGLPVTRWHVSPGGPNASKVAQKLVAFTAMRAGDDVVIAEGNCPWGEREIWEQRLADFVATLKP